MKMPGFTAELSLDKPRQYYRSTAGRAEFAGEQTVQSQLGFNTKQRCFRECLRATCESDPNYCVENCRCECYGIQGVTCWQR